LESLENYAKHLTSESDKQLNAQYAAEVRFFRAYAYFQLVNLFGDVPLLLDNQELNVFKNTKEDVKKYIYDELDYCIANLPAIRPNESEHPGAVTKYTAEMLKAKQKMYDNEWDEVLALTEDIVNSGKFELYNDFYELFKIPGKLCNESLLEYQFTDFGNGSGDIVSSDNWFAFQGPRGEAPISGWAFIEPTEKIRNLFSKRGEAVRAETTFLMTDATTRDGDYIPVAQPGEPTAYNGKAYTPANQMTPGRTGYGDNNNIRVFRYADVLLMNAEAKVRKGQNGDAPLNLVRERAGLAPIANATLDQILEERQVELALEWGERFFDLVRTDRATQELPGFVKGESEYYPIPQDQIDLNPNLEAEPVPFEPEVTE
jgi:starch-binding outer membrane protein, SusD/RagB family